MVRGEHKRNKVYASLQDLKTKTRYTDVLNGSEQEIRRYSDVKKKDDNYEPRYPA